MIMITTLTLLSTKAITVGHFIAAAVIAFILGLLIGAQLTSHEERALDYNLEDVELDELKRLETLATSAGKRAIAKLKAAGFVLRSQVKSAEHKVTSGFANTGAAVKKDISKL